MNENNHCCCNAGYYESLSAAVADINSGVVRISVANGGKVVVTHAHEGRPTVRLMEDITERVAITVNKDMDLDLNGKTISFTEEGCLSFGADTDCTICGAVEGSAIQRTLAENATSQHLLEAAGASLKLKGGSYQISGYHPSNFLCIRATGTCGLLELTDCQVAAVNGENETATGVKAIQTQAAETKVMGSTLITEAGSYAQGVFGMGRITIDGSTINADSRSGNSRTVYSVGGTVTIDGSNVHAGAVSHFAQAVYGNGGTVTIGDSTIDAASVNEVAYAVYDADGAVTVNGSTLNADSTTSNAYAVCSAGVAKFVIEDSAIHADSQTGEADGVRIIGGTVTIDGSEIDAITHSEDGGSAYGVYAESGSTLQVRNTQIMADARGNDTDAGSYAIAITNNGTAFLENVVLNGTHSGVQNGGKLYVSGGTYTGHCHGGFYLAHGSEGEAFINDATLRGGNYAGVFDYTALENRKFSALYIGGVGENGSNMAAYLDGCTIDGSDANASIVVRGTSDEQNNTLNVSNCTLVNPAKWIRVDSNDLRINIGMGGNITEASLKNTETDGSPVDYVEQGRAVFTDSLYRRLHANHICDGKDYAALTALVEAKLTA